MAIKTNLFASLYTMIWIDWTNKINKKITFYKLLINQTQNR